MRVRHLTDFELQGMLDRRDPGLEGDVPRSVYLKDLEAQEHLDSCLTCREELALYRELYGVLAEPEKGYLPRNFARKVTFSLPPFRAQRTRFRLQMAAVWAIAGSTLAAWSFARADWPAIIRMLLSWMLPIWGLAQTMIHSVTSLIPVTVAYLLSQIPPTPPIFNRLGDALTSGAGPVSFVLVAGMLLAMIASLDRLYINGLLRNSHEH